jgi:hypothetical protein
MRLANIGSCPMSLALHLHHQMFWRVRDSACVGIAVSYKPWEYVTFTDF